MVTVVALACVAAACTTTGDSIPGDSTTGDSAVASSASATSTSTSPGPSEGDATAASDDPPATSGQATSPGTAAVVSDPPIDPTTSTTSTATTTLVEGPSASCVAELTVRERAALLVWPAVYADDWPSAVATVRNNDIGGVLLMSQDGLDAETVTARLAELEAASRHGLIVSTDEEGGDVQRLRDLEPLSSQRVLARDFTTDEVAAQIADHGTTVRGVGVDMVLGPVVDVEPNVGDVPLRPSRFFGGPPDTVSAYGAAYLSGWDRAGLFATLKHYPGHGAASGDTHITAGITPSLDDLDGFDLKPYRDLVDLAGATQTAVMIGHLTVPGLTDGVPATRSPAAISYLRNDLGYGDALLITDALGMAAVGIPEPEASVLALQAGIDVVLFTLSSQTDEVIDAIDRAVASGTLSEAHVTEAATKVMSMLARDGHTCNSNR